MSENKVRKTVSLNKKNPDDLKILKRIKHGEEEKFNFNDFAREAMLEKIRREEMAIIKSEKGGIKIVVGR
ncbi:hypothetical protein [Mesobacillus jeotgali]|uniref:hypothetical protein n=1 Tax=Mesobacillus jeotgali TaxID=129985 RepID=UPI001CFE8D9C|nr:hypothetical protein [Mesobacillus jeotgali]